MYRNMRSGCLSVAVNLVFLLASLSVSVSQIASELSCGDIPMFASITIENPIQYYSFTLPDPSTGVSFTTCSKHTTLNTRIILYDSYLTPIAFNDDDPECSYYPLASTLIVDETTMTPQQIYYTSVSVYDYPRCIVDCQGQFTLTVTCHTNAIAVPSTMTCHSNTIFGSITANTPIYYYQFEYLKQYISITFTTCTKHKISYDTKIILYDDSWNQIDAVDDSDCEYSLGQSTLTIPNNLITLNKVYYLGVTYYQYPNYIDAGTFALDIHCQNETHRTITANISCDDSSLSIESITGDAPVFYYQFSVPDSYTKVSFTTCNNYTKVDTILTVYASDFTEIDRNDIADMECLWYYLSSTLILDTLQSESLYYIAVSSFTDGRFALEMQCTNSTIQPPVELHLECGVDTPITHISSNNEQLFYAFDYPIGYDLITFTTCDYNFWTSKTDMNARITLYDSNLKYIDHEYVDHWNCMKALNGTLSIRINGTSPENTLYYVSVTFSQYSQPAETGAFFLQTNCYSSQNVSCSTLDEAVNTCYINKTDPGFLNAIVCDPLSSNCVVTCGTDHACNAELSFEKEIHCPSNECDTCIINCESDYSCKGLTIHGHQCLLVEINVQNIENSNNIIYAPGNGGRLVVDVYDYADFHTNEIYSSIGSLDISINIALAC
eukprot:195689_1